MTQLTPLRGKPREFCWGDADESQEERQKPPGNYEKVKRSGIISWPTTIGMDNRNVTVLDDAALGSRIGLQAEPREGILLKIWKIKWPYSALTGEQVRYE